jgi:AcrR family transcriptional regulator
MARPADPHARSALVAAARAEFVRHGIVRARIEDITTACGLSKGAFYLHFESKEALFREVVAELMGVFEEIRRTREAQYKAVVGARRQKGALAHDADFMRSLNELEAREDRRLLQLLWLWRDVIDVLLRGCQGTEFEGVMWAVLDDQVARVKLECDELKKVGLVRDDVQGEVIGMMVVGTYMLVARKLSVATEQPDFEALVASLQRVLALGTHPPHPTRHRAVRPRRVVAPSNSRKVMKKRSAR